MRWFSRLGLRQRLMIIGVTGLGISLAAGGLVLYEALSFSIVRTVDNEARSAAEQVAAMVDVDQIPDPLPISGAQIVQIVDSRGRVIGGSVNADRLTPLLRPDELTTVVAGSPITVNGARAGLAGPLRVVALAAGPAAARRDVIVALQIGDLDHSAAVLRTALLIAFPILLAFLAFVAWRVIGWTLRPVEALRSAAARLSGTVEDERLPLPRSQDEIRALAETLNDMLTRLAMASSRQRDFVADAAHELRSPLASMRMQLEVASRLGEAGTLPGDVLLDVDRLTALVEDLLLLAKADAGHRSPAHPSTFALQTLLAEVAATHRVTGASVTHVESGAIELTADRDEIRRAIVNLTDNAARHARHTVLLHGERRDDRVIISVTDDGPGIAPADRERIFQRFTRLDDARGRDSGGSGLGLPIARELVTRAGGSIRFENTTEGPGATAVVDLPVSDRKLLLE